VEQDFQGKLGVGISGFNVPTPIVVAYDFAVPLDHQLGNATTINPELGGVIKNFHPVVEDAVVNFKTSFFPHDASSSSLKALNTGVELSIEVDTVSGLSAVLLLGDDANAALVGTVHSVDAFPLGKLGFDLLDLFFRHGVVLP